MDWSVHSDMASSPWAIFAGSGARGFGVGNRRASGGIGWPKRRQSRQPRMGCRLKRQQRTARFALELLLLGLWQAGHLVEGGTAGVYGAPQFLAFRRRRLNKCLV